MFIRHVLEGRSTDFAALKGAHSFASDAGNSWASKLELPGMKCWVNNNWAFQCATKPGTLTEVEARKTFHDLLLAFRQADLSWLFVKSGNRQ